MKAWKGEEGDELEVLEGDAWRARAMEVFGHVPEDISEEEQAKMAPEILCMLDRIESHPAAALLPPSTAAGLAHVRRYLTRLGSKSEER